MCGVQAEAAWDDQCTGANPRYPLIADLKQMLRDAWGQPILPLHSLEGGHASDAPIVAVPHPGSASLAALNN